MARSVTLTQIRQQNGRIFLRFGKETYEFNSLADIRDYVQSILGKAELHALFMACAIERQAALNNPAQLEGRTLTVDFSLNNWGTVA